jgi:5'-methylthioadenosine phosphorylase
VTDYDAWKEDTAHVTIQQVIEYLHRNSAQAKAIIQAVLPRIPAVPGCSCHSALQHAILTDRRWWPPKVRAALKPILAKYL